MVLIIISVFPKCWKRSLKNLFKGQPFCLFKFFLLNVNEAGIMKSKTICVFGRGYSDSQYNNTRGKGLLNKMCYMNLTKAWVKGVQNLIFRQTIHFQFIFPESSRVSSGTSSWKLECWGNVEDSTSWMSHGNSGL